MGITEKELKKILSISSDIEKVTTLSFDGKNLLTRVPKDVCESLELRKGHKIHWLVSNDNKQIRLNITDED